MRNTNLQINYTRIMYINLIHEWGFQKIPDKIEPNTVYIEGYDHHHNMILLDLLQRFKGGFTLEIVSIQFTALTDWRGKMSLPQ